MKNWYAILFFGVAGVVGFCLPPPIQTYLFRPIRLLDAALTISLGVFAWGAFHLVEPAHHNRRWIILRETSILLLWSFLVWLMAIWFGYIYDHHFDLMQR
jgi:hypothetical protein